MSNPHPFSYPQDDDTPNVLINPKWLHIPINEPDAAANWYISGTGIVDFSSEDPEWSWKDATLPVVPGKLKLTFASDSPLQSGDTYIQGSGFATVGLGRVEREVSHATDPVGIAIDDW